VPEITPAEVDADADRDVQLDAEVEWAEPLPPARLVDALPPRSEFDAGIHALLERDGGPTLVEPPVAAPEATPAGAAGTTLPRRVPGATTEALPQPSAAPPLRRSPDEVRALLSRYRSGLAAGRVNDGPADEEPS
jgi:hypothetical protein